MKNTLMAVLSGSTHQNTTTQNIGFLLLRFFAGLALCTVFEKFLPKNGVWGPQEWFIQDTANMGFPFPTFFAWVAVLSEFFGGILMMLGLFTRPAALMNVMVTFTATFIYHDGDIGGAALTSFFFMIMCLCILLFGPGKYSLDHALYKQFSKQWKTVSVIVILVFSFSSTSVTATGHPIPEQLQILVHDSSKVSFYLKNNTIIPKRVTFIIYQPHQEGNNTLVMWFLPLQKKRWNLPAGSSIYLASDSQVDRVMQGMRIDNDEPYIKVDKTMSDATIAIKSGG